MRLSSFCSAQHYLAPHSETLPFIHAGQATTAGQVYKECTDPPWYALKHQDGLGVLGNVENLLNHASKPLMLFYNGMNDIICHHFGNERFLFALDNWPGVGGFKSSSRYNWGSRGGKGGESGGGPVGYLREHDNLQFLMMRDSGHMVPMDLPKETLDMMRELVWDGGVGRAGGDKRKQKVGSLADGGVCDLDSGRGRRVEGKGKGEGGKGGELEVEEEEEEEDRGAEFAGQLRKLSGGGGGIDFKGGSNPNKPCMTYIEGEGNPPAAGGSSAGILFVGFFAIAGVFLCFKVRKDLRENAEKAKGYKNVSNEDEEGEGGDERDGGGGGGRGTRMWK